MPKIPRRLKLKVEEEAALLGSGNVFVFDEGESGIRRWTDGMLWSPSRVLNNFLIYRQVHSKTSKNAKTEDASSQPASAPLPSGLAVGAPLMAPNLYGNDESGPSGVRRDSEGSMLSENFSPNVPNFGYFQGPPNVGSSEMPFQQPSHYYNQAQNQTWSAPNSAGSSNSFQNIPSGQVAAASPHAFDSRSRRNSKAEDPTEGGQHARDSHSAIQPDDILMDRDLVGSLTSNYSFIKGGLCKKTISMKIEGSTQHLISYYSVEDVRAHRLRTPSSLPEFARIQISSIFLNPVNFREPPQTEIGPDGGLKYVSDKPQSSRTSGHGSSSEGTSGSDSRTGSGGRAVRVTLNQSGRASPTAIFTSASPTTTTTSSPNLDPKRSDGSVRLPHQIGGSGALSSEGTSAMLPRRMSDGPLRGRFGSGGGRYEPYPHPISTFNSGMPIIPTRGSRPATPAGSPFEATSPTSSRGERGSRHLAHQASLGSHLNLSVWQQTQSEGNSPFHTPGMSAYAANSENGGSSRGVVASGNTNYDSSWSDNRIPLLPPASIGQVPSHASASASSSSAGSESRHRHRQEPSAGSSSSHSSLYGSQGQRSHQQRQHQAALSPVLGSGQAFLPSEIQNLDSRSPWEVAAGPGQSFPYENALQGSNSFQYVNSDRYSYGDTFNQPHASSTAGTRGLELDAWPQQQHQHQQQRIQNRPGRAQSTSVILPFSHNSNDNSSPHFYLPNFSSNSSQRSHDR